jgi:AraC-like DNA-binding protein
VGGLDAVGVSGHRERPSRLGGWATVWEGGAAAGPVRVLPDGCLDVIWLDGTLVVAGPDTRAYLYRPAPGGGPATGVRFAPGFGPAVLGVPADALTDARVPLADVWPARRVRELSERLAAADGAGRGAVLEAALRDRLGGNRPPVEPWVPAAVAALAEGRPVAAVAGELGVSERQLRRRSGAAFGYGPKTLTRVLRLRRALRLARRPGLTGAAVAAAAGYADQAHLARDVRALAGVPLTALLRPGAPDGARGAGAQPGSGANSSTALPSGSSTIA